MRTLQDEVVAIEAELKAAAVSLDHVLSAAGVDRSTWTRWKSGKVIGARYDTWSKVREAVEHALSEAPPRGVDPPQAAA